MKNLNISVLEGCKDVEGNLHKVGDSYIGQHSAFSSSQYQNKKVCSATKNCSGWLQKKLLVLKKKKMQLKNHLLSIDIIIAIIITFLSKELMVATILVNIISTIVNIIFEQSHSHLPSSPRS